MQAEQKYGDAKTVATITGISKSHLDRLRAYRPDSSPPFVRIGRRCLYPLTGANSLETWLADRTVGGKR